MNHFKEKAMKCVFLIAACTSVLAVFLICAFLFANGVPAIGKIGPLKFLLGTKWKPSNDIFGILPMIVASIYVTAGAILLGVPIALFTSVFMARYCPKKIYRPLKSGIELMAGVPSIVYGFFGLILIVPLIRQIFGGTGTSMLAATKERSIFFVMLPAAKSGILAAVVLGIGRAIGETMAVVMVAGNQPRMPQGILKGVRTMTANIVTEMGYATGLHREALIATAVVLFIFILIINLSLSLLNRRAEHAN